MRFFLAFTLLLTSISNIFSQYIQNTDNSKNPIEKEGYTNILNEEFNDSSSIDYYYPFYNSDGTIQQPNATWRINEGVFNMEDLNKHAFSKDNIILDSSGEGKLTIKTIKQPKSVYVWQNETYHTFDITNGMVTSLLNYKYGYFEIRCKISKGENLWPAFWFFGQTGQVGDANFHRAEIDVFEIFPNVHGASRLGANYHYEHDTYGFIDHANNITYNQDGLYAGYPFTNHQYYPHALKPWVLSENNLSEEFNTYAVEWTPTQLKYYFNNELYLIEELSDVEDELYEEMNIKINDYIKKSGNWDYDLEKIPNNAEFVIDYVRIYKRNPEIELTSTSNCKDDILTFTAHGIPGDSYEWSFDDISKVDLYSNLNSQSISYKLKTQYLDSRVELTCTATQTDNDNLNILGSASTTITTPTLDPSFKLLTPTCANGNLNVLAVADYYDGLSGSMWILEYWNSQSNSWVSESTAYGGSCSFTIPNLNNDYRIKHGTWSGNNGSCVNWDQEIQNIEPNNLNLSQYNLAEPTCTNGIVSISATADTYTSGSQWDLFSVDQYDNIISQISSSIFGTSCSFNDLEAGRYMLKHGTWGNCTGWQQTLKYFNVEEFKLDPAFYVNSYYDKSSNFNVSVTAKENPISHSNQWDLFYSDNTGSIGQQITTKWGNNTTFLNLNPTQYYLIKHGAWSDCTNWEQSIYLIKGSNVYKSFAPCGDSIYSGTHAVTELTSNNESNIEQIEVFPNPSNGIITIKLKGTTILSIYNSIGKLILNKTISNSTTIDLSQYGKGLYYIKTNSESNFSNKKVVIQ